MKISTVPPKRPTAPGLAVIDRYSRALYDLPGMNSVRWLAKAPTTVTLTFNSVEMAAAARAILRPTINGANFEFLTEDGTALPAPTPPGAKPAWFERPETLGDIAASFHGVVSNWPNDSGQLVLMTTTQGIADYYAPLINSKFGNRHVQLIDDPTVEGPGLASFKTGPVGHAIDGGWIVTPSDV